MSACIIYIYIYVYTYLYMHVYIYIYIYVRRAAIQNARASVHERRHITLAWCCITSDSAYTCVACTYDLWPMKKLAIGWRNGKKEWNTAIRLMTTLSMMLKMTTLHADKSLTHSHLACFPFCVLLLLQLLARIIPLCHVPLLP